ncbi:MFS transporter, ACS family, solute carrier family 17 (sodium-dependent inorganic phosphate cotransporter), other [Nesidiocoris tenuis]|uniref:MFS transporter, ACS family, solute carrier family 17 (Sodium-dependent inorganic phosphate cotransporter), other n=1 Tax=Nesidiocoris tenuis TaxID=355587 RepID=A0ABN7B5P1_9HEMI|nr:MFS transporter, ACS family, solute carrier family 17 (sodium-dependent inorganic phosphate cotransporter), other [Nesidiocoris tenuis]
MDQENFEASFNEIGGPPTERASLLPRRYVVALLSFFGFANIYAMRVNLSVAIVVMRNNRTVIAPNGTQIVIGPEFNWSSGVDGVILGSFFYGYILTQIIGGYLACKHGGKRLFGLGVGVTAVVTLLTPLLARTSIYLLVFGRIVEGLFEGVTFPAMHGIWSKWSPPEERSRLVSISYSGCYFGTVAALPLCGALAERLGWASIFYVFGMFGCIWTAIWMYVVADSPSDDAKISHQEKEYIEDSLGPANRVKLNVPWKAMFKSLPVWAIIVAHFSENWGFYTLLTELPTYLDDVFGYDFLRAGLLAALPYLAMAVIVQTSGFLADWFRTSHLTTMQVRKLFTCLGFLTRATFLVAAANASTPTAIVTCLTVAVGFGGLSYAGFSVNHLDIAPQYASILMGISNTFATFPGILSPMVTGLIVTTGSKDEWQTILYIAAAVYVFGATAYALLGSGKIQAWAMVAQEQVFLSDNDQSQTSTEDLIPVPTPRYQSTQ